MRKSIFKIYWVLFSVILISGWSFAQEKEPYKEAYLKPDESIQDILTRDRHFDELDALGPDGIHFMIPIQRQFSSLELMSQKTYRLAMLEFCPDVNREWRLSTYGTEKLKIYSLEKRDFWMVDLPGDILISDMTWSPDGEKIAFLAHLEQGSQVWTADVKTGKAGPVAEDFVMATLGGVRSYWRGSSGSNMLQWTFDGSLLTLLVPSDRGPEPEKDPVPDTPIIRHTRDKETPTRTYPFLLRTTHDKDLFEHYTTAQLAVLSPDQSVKKLGEPAMYLNISLSPDGKYILAEKLVRPFSYIVSYRDFPKELVVLNREGDVISTIRETPLNEAISRNSSPLRFLPRDVAWHPDGKGLFFLQLEKKDKQKEEEEGSEEDEKQMDRLIFLPPPFDMENSQILVKSENRLNDVSFSANGEYAFATRSDKGKQEIIAFDLTKKEPKTLIIKKDIDTDDILNLPGDIMTRRTGNGIAYTLTSSDGKSIYLEGEGYKENFKPQPFIKKVEIKTGKEELIFEGSSEMYEEPLAVVDKDMNKIIISRESQATFPQSYLRESDGTLTQLTDNQYPFPEFKDCQRIHFEFTRRDGLKCYGQISLPVDYKKGERVPAVFWTYPREYQSFEDYKKSAIRGNNKNAFPHLSTRNASDIWLAQGYAVVTPDIPIIGKGDTYNNHYIAHLVDSMYAAIRKVDNMGYVDVDRLGHGGHSYGAFATGNILAHSPFFKAGIAGDGAYNRTLTPMTFQRENRFIWDAQDIYIEMSPFFEADHINTPMLMYHGAVDNNSGTFLIQSERLIQALTGLGKEAVLYIYPYESHGPRCTETYMDLWTRWVEWFDKYVKKPTEQ
ncbi:MAG: prolyl oligopeptidase family serine peptidase [Acidobacteriota bacterium]